MDSPIPRPSKLWQGRQFRWNLGNDIMQILRLASTFARQWNGIPFENTPSRFIPHSNTICESILHQLDQWDHRWSSGDIQLKYPLKLFFLPHDLWPMTLAYKSDLYILPLELHAEIQLCMFGRESGNKHAHTQTRSKLLHLGCINNEGAMKNSITS